MRKKIYFVLCMATCLIFATACNKNNSENLTTSAYNDTVSDMEKTTEATTDSSDTSSTDDKNSTEKNSSSEKDTSTTTTSNEKSTTSSSSTEAKSTTAASEATEKTTETTSDDEVITAEGDENFEEPTTATKESEKETWASSGTLSGFNDSDSVEIIMQDGSTKTFFVYDEDIVKQLEELLDSGEENSIDFVYRPIAGQANSQIIEIK